MTLVRPTQPAADDRANLLADLQSSRIEVKILKDAGVALQTELQEATTSCAGMTARMDILTHTCLTLEKERNELREILHHSQFPVREATTEVSVLSYRGLADELRDTVGDGHGARTRRRPNGMS